MPTLTEATRAPVETTHARLAVQWRAPDALTVDDVDRQIRSVGWLIQLAHGVVAPRVTSVMEDVTLEGLVEEREQATASGTSGTSGLTLAQINRLIKEMQGGRGAARQSRSPVLYAEATSGDVRVLEMSYRSPLSAVLEVVPVAAGAASGLGVIFYGLKRLYGLDLEFRAYREQRRLDFLRAKALADQAIADDESLGHPDVRDAVAKKVTGTIGWGGEAVLFDEDDA